MPSRKQRRRREKLKRHEYEYVVETDEGEEVPLERPTREKASSRDRGRGGRGADRRPAARGERPIPEPSLRRVLKRTAIFAPLLLAVMFLTGPELTTLQKVVNALVLLAFFIPFSYVVDLLVYRALMRRKTRRAE